MGPENRPGFGIIGSVAVRVTRRNKGRGVGTNGQALACADLNPSAARHAKDHDGFAERTSPPHEVALRSREKSSRNWQEPAKERRFSGVANDRIRQHHQLLARKSLPAVS